MLSSNNLLQINSAACIQRLKNKSNSIQLHSVSKNYLCLHLHFLLFFYIDFEEQVK